MAQETQTGALDQPRGTRVQKGSEGVHKVLDLLSRSTRSLLSDRGNICKERD